MWYVDPISDEAAEGVLRELYDLELQKDGFVANTTRAWSYRPEVFAHWQNLNKAIRGNMRLRTFELVTLAAARAIGCVY